LPAKIKSYEDEFMEQQNLIPLPSLAERDRRYKNVRERMAREGLDVLLLPANHSRWEQMMADSRYLSGIGGFATEVFTVFPAEGDPTAYVFNRAGWWKQAQNWTADVRDGRNRWAQNAIEKINELGFKKGRIGISGLAGLVRAPEGIISYSTVETIRQAFPDSEIVNATVLMQEARALKSDEEIAFLQRSMDIIEEMIRTMKESARPGVTEKDLYAEMIHTMLRHDGELPTLFFLGTGPQATQSTFVPTTRVIQDGDRVVNEIEAKVGGYAAQAVCPIVVGRAKDNYEEMVDLSATCFHAILQQMRPGVTFGTLFDTYQKTVQEKGKDMYRWSHPMMHSRGLGDDAPALMGDKDLERLANRQLERGMAFILKPRVRHASGKGSASIGDTVVVEQNGARRLGRREMKLLRAE
jgi:Xaa-Pro dipeptidase